MKIAVPVKFVPDLVEELTVDPSGNKLDSSWLRQIISEFDDHAVEQAILIKEKQGGQVVVAATDADGVDDFLFTAAAKGADELIKFTGDFSNLNNHALARLYSNLMKEIKPDLILTGVQAHNDTDGALGPLLAENLGIPYVGYIAGVQPSQDQVLVKKEYIGGLVAEMSIKLPAVLGIQVAEQPPRYIAYSKIRQVMSTAKIIEKTAQDLGPSSAVVITRMYQPESTEHATMLEGSTEVVAEKLIGIFKELGTL
jgi:electron transfer flavoprotein beta subunit